jgi:hypothetical protein
MARIIEVDDERAIAEGVAAYRSRHRAGQDGA